ncbi:SGNH hydrolase domain-containing protein [Erythrobacter sp. Alg231-14]|uniref:SGNH hydrolase domain-containing protein n=1 Tax=Erythrobacter sp. Alg231-14 TaxID=1922225 RepID=UPI000D557E5C
MNTAPPYPHATAPSPVSGHAYRRDIDGLRALAVLPVLLYHAKVPGFSGGFIGVDIFFVISGFLITGIIAREIDAGEFSILTFYERRARRILPALLAMIAFVLIMASALFLPSDFAGVAPTALAAIGFLANVWLFTQTGYFQGDADTIPLLHTWSLGVEEQFYIAVPIAFIVIAKMAPGWRIKAVIAATLLSFIWAAMKQADSDGFAFYMLPTRAWEMLAGSILALGLIPAVKHRVVSEIVCATALIAILAASALYDRQTVFPGVTALAPVIAAMALIHCAPGTAVGRMLSLKGPVWIGLISYSLYLWHWPIIVFWRYSLDEKLTLVHASGLILLSILVAWTSWRFIEQPFRSKSRFPAKRIWLWSGAGMAAIGAIAVFFVAQGGWSNRFDDETLRMADAASDHSPVRMDCVADRITNHSRVCNLGAETEPSSIIWGDSHAVEIAWALGENYGARGESIIQRTRGSCPPAIGFDPPKDPRCTMFNASVLEEIAASPEISTVYLAGYWAQPPYQIAGINELLDETIARLHALGKTVTLIGPIPTQPVAVPRLLAMHGPDAPTLSTADFLAVADGFRQNYPAWRARGVVIIDPIDRLSDNGQTIIVAAGQPLYYDDHHLSLAGARHILGTPIQE